VRRPGEAVQCRAAQARAGAGALRPGAAHEEEPWRERSVRETHQMKEPEGAERTRALPFYRVRQFFWSALISDLRGIFSYWNGSAPSLSNQATQRTS
jgi:hypothetical protein